MRAVPVSIVIPSYNGAKFMSNLIDSLQPYYDSGCEIILVEDGSTDGTKEIFLKAFPNARYIWQENAGPAKARLKGVEHATGEYVQLLDVDDTIESGKLGAQYQFAVDHSVDVVYSGWRYAFKNGASNEAQYGDWILNDICEDVVTGIFKTWWFPPAAMIVSRKAFLSIRGGDLSLTTTEDDVDLYLRLFTRGYKFGYCEGQFANHFQYENTITRSGIRSEGFWRDVAQVIISTIEYLEEHNDLSEDRKKAGLKKLFVTARNMAKTNIVKAEKYWDFIKQVDSNYIPENQSKIFMFFFNKLGYCNAERLAIAIEKLRGKKGYNSVQNHRIYTAQNGNKL